jgi:hypothetical protein
VRWKGLFSFENPLPKRAVVPLHDDDIRVIDNPVVVHFGNPVVKSEILQTRDLGKNIMQHAPLIDRLGKVHFLDGHFSGLTDISLTRVNNPICPRINFLPVLVVRYISERVSQEFK